MNKVTPNESPFIMYLITQNYDLKGRFYRGHFFISAAILLGAKISITKKIVYKTFLI